MSDAAAVEVLARLARQPRVAQALEVLLGPAGDARRGERLAQQRAAAAGGGADEVGHRVKCLSRPPYRVIPSMPPPNILYLHSHDTGPLRPALRPSRARRRTSSGSPTRVCCSARRSAPRPPARAAVPACSPAGGPLQRDDGPRASRVRAARLRPPPPPHAPRRGLLVRPDRRAAPLRGPRDAGLRPRGGDRDDARRDRRARGAGAPRSTAAAPFFLSVGFFETHREFFEPTSVRDALYSLPPANLPDTPAVRRDMAAFKASARSLDQGVGAVLDALDPVGSPTTRS